MRDPRARAIFGEIHPQQGFYEVEADMWGPFVWARKCFGVRLSRRIDHVSLRLCYYGNSGKLIVKRTGTPFGEISLHRGWHTYPLDLSAMNSGEVEFELDHLVPVAGDSRELGVMIRKIRVLESRNSYDGVQRILANRIENDREYAVGRIKAHSFPPQLRIDIEPSCNIKPPCAYCGWDSIKKIEAESDHRLSLHTLAEMGGFYDLAEQVVDCSYGEPFLNEDLWRIVEDFDKMGKYFEMTTNGQLLGQESRARILGKNITLYVSLDSAIADGYKRYRNDGFHSVVENLRALCREKKERDGLPRVIVSFIAMKSNREEFGRFLDLMKDIEIDAVKLRSLFADQDTGENPVIHNGYSFVYRAEILPLEQLTEFVEASRAAAIAKGVDLIAEADFGSDPAQQNKPFCSEPWKTIFVLRRGILPCCFAKRPFAKWSETRDLPLDLFLAKVWNGKRYQELRRSLAQGSPSEFCLEQKSCPIVNRRACPTGRS